MGSKIAQKAWSGHFGGGGAAIQPKGGPENSPPGPVTNRGYPNKIPKMGGEEPAIKRHIEREGGHACPSLPSRYSHGYYISSGSQGSKEASQGRGQGQGSRKEACTEGMGTTYGQINLLPIIDLQ